MSTGWELFRVFILLLCCVAGVNSLSLWRSLLRAQARLLERVYVLGIVLVHGVLFGMASGRPIRGALVYVTILGVPLAREHRRDSRRRALDALENS